MLEKREDSVIIQKWDISCGAAALATLLTYDQGDPVTEREVAAGMLHYTSVARVRAQLGFSLLDLKRYAEGRGFTADGYGNMTLRDLTETGPAIVPITLRGLNHFVVFRGIQGDRVLLADPGWGNRTMQVPNFLEVWNTRVAFAVSRKGEKPVHRLMATATNFWASSTAFETPAKKIVVAKLMDQPPAKSQTMVASSDTAGPLAQTAAGPGSVPTQGALPESSQPDIASPEHGKPAASRSRAASAMASANLILAAATVQPGDTAATRRPATMVMARAEPAKVVAAARAGALEKELSTMLQKTAVLQPPPAAIAAKSKTGHEPAAGRSSAPVALQQTAAPGGTAGKAAATQIAALDKRLSIMIREVAERQAVLAASEATANAAQPKPSQEADTPAGAGASSVVANLIKRADALLALRDVTSARLLYERAAQAGSGQAATAAGRTFDPNALAQLGAVGMKTDPAAAARWYQKAVALGDTAAEPLLRALQAAGGA